MKVERIEAQHVTIPLVTPYVLSRKYGTVTHAHAVVVRVQTDDGLVGLGEADPLPPFTEECWAGVLGTIERVLGPLLIGEDPRNIVANNSLFDGLLHGNALAKGALDMAMWDLLGKSLGVPVWRLLGGKLRDVVPLLWPLGSGTAAQDLERIEAKLPEGYGTFMIKMGALPIETEITRARAIEDRFGDSIHWNVDANQGWDLSMALKFMDGTAGCRMDFVEQPVPRGQIEQLRVLRGRATHPISADEGVQTAGEALALASAGLADVFSLKVTKNGGISRSMDIAAIARLHGLGCLCNSMIELGITQAAALNVAATLPNLVPGGHCFMSTLRLQDDITDFRSLLHQAQATVPDAPGLGIELDPEALRHHGAESVTIRQEASCSITC
jgi:L-alanine-DL-glutamate epimerase-like enolase superfamily enzyme